MGILVSSSAGPGDVQIGSPSLSDLTLTKTGDVNSAQFRKLIYEKTEIPYLEVYFLKLGGSETIVNQVTRYERCFISSFSASSGGGETSESFSITYVRACHRSYERDSAGAIVRQVDTCYDKTNPNGPCSCGPF